MIFIILFHKPIIHAFVDALIKEAAIRRDYIGNETVSTIYFGGGTPSVLSVTELGTFLKISEALHG